MKKKPPSRESESQPLDVTILPPSAPNQERTAKSLRRLRELAELILAREAREKEKRHDPAA